MNPIRKVIFLDVDGVLVTWDSMESVDKGEFAFDQQHKWRHKMFGQQQLTNLAKLVKETGADVVLSSSWRMEGQPEIFNGILEAAGSPVRIIDQTPRLWSEPTSSLGIIVADTRANEIFTWLKPNKPCRFVVLDDDEMADLGDSNDFHIHTSMEFGLTASDVDKAIAILNAP